MSDDPFSRRRAPSNRNAGRQRARALRSPSCRAALKRTVEDAFGHVRVRGEISGFKRVALGPLLFHAQGRCGLHRRGDLARPGGARSRFQPEDGIEVIATGKLTTYPARSRYQIVVERLELAGQGALMALLDKRRRALAAEGLFDAERKRPLPFAPRRDRRRHLADRRGDPRHPPPARGPLPDATSSLWPVPVQGEGAAEKIAAAVARLQRAAPAPPDLLIVARGGGSIEDLWAFNEEVVVRAVAGSAIPIISAVGHETDTTLVRLRRRRARADADRRGRDGGAGARRAARPGPRARRAGPSAAPAATRERGGRAAAGAAAPLARARGAARAAAAAARRARRAAAARPCAAGSTGRAASSAGPPARSARPARIGASTGRRSGSTRLWRVAELAHPEPAARARLCPGRGPRRARP